MLLHGFTQSAGSWAPLAERLAASHEVVAVDAPGHGGAGEVRAGLWDGAGMIADAGGRGAYVGYSMGGRFAIHVAVAHPELVERLVLVSTTAGIDDPHQRAERAVSDERIAQRVERDGVPAFLDWWLERPLFATLTHDAAGLDSRLGGSAAGLASSLRLAGTGVQEPLWDRLGEITVPVLVVAGELDSAYLARADRLVGAIGANASLAVLSGAGHACHLERPEAWLATVGAWLAGDGWRPIPTTGPVRR